MNVKSLLREVLAVALVGIGSLGAATLEEDFVNPPQSRGAYAWWHWCQNNVSKAGITRDLEAMKSAGLAGATVFFIDLAGFDMENGVEPKMTFRSPKWWELFGFAVAEAKRLGLQLGFCNGAGYSCSGGPWITPELSMKKLVWTSSAKGSRPAQPETVRGFYRDITEIAVGETVYRFGYTSTGKCLHPVPSEIKETALEADKMSAKAMNVHWDHAIGEIVKRIPPSDPGLTHVMMDSYEAGEHDWTDDFAAEFRRRRGYDPIPLLPVLAGATVKGEAADAKFKDDMRLTKHELLTENHYALFHRRAAEAGLEMHLEPYTGDFDAMEASRAADVVMTEFWAFPVFWAPDPDRVGGGVWHCGPVARAHAKPIIGAESFTAMPMDDMWCVSPKHLKRQTDATLARGVNRLSLHHWVHQPLDPKFAPGFTMGFWGTHFGECQTWFEPGKAFYRYIQRCQAMLQRGEEIVDTLAIDEGANEGESVDAITDSELLAGAVEVLPDGRLRLESGRTYRYLREPWSYVPSPKVKAAIAALVAKGAKPWRTEFAEKGLVVVEDAAWRGKVLASGRADGGTTFFFVANTTTNDARNLVLRFRVSGLKPEIWCPETLVRREAADWAAAGDVTRVRLALPRESAVFVVFRESAKAPRGALAAAKAPASAPRSLDVAGPWHVAFLAGRAADGMRRDFDALLDWAKHPDAKVRHFSGTAEYRAEFDCPADFAAARARLDLGEVCDIAEVELNGKRLGTAWHAPFALDATGALRAGRNELKVRVTNAWANRLIGDESLPLDLEKGEAGRMTGVDKVERPVGWAIRRLPEWVFTGAARPSGRKAFSTWNYFTADSPLYPSGLIGPVRLSEIGAD